MPIDVAAAVGAPPAETSISWQHKDVQLYHLGLGAGTDPLDPAELRYTLEDRLTVLPSFATVAGGGMAMMDGLSAPGVDVDLMAVLHAGQRVEVHRPIPSGGTATQTSRVVAVHDKGKAAVLVLRVEAADADGPLWTCDSELYLRGEGGFGGDRGPSGRLERPDRAPDLTADRPTTPGQALLYRLSGDWNPLHSPPEFAALAGFDRPILQGLCTYGIALKTVVDRVLDGATDRVRSCATRFSGVVVPGETLRVRMWTSPGRVQLTVTAVERDDADVLTDTVVEHD
ncbi:MaoC/PaaZ C-terminal domain-containing protein [Streptantibioticus silvisoli]|uniref:MaoC/PaaZ C-terminal domain-containing protein n=1 Tax=Streptantibioticus silvisoli TaxID=2705255 RepID=A0ABT6VUY0_9ACTN|nr:MaoC/PaaZ C-terminal domain-containing protein [Streptantibioticus silvisoli]MDI5961577.1 MaoC/PaaZ C-terminal domain-containing protein [Streptantibioticus silvisoli]